MELAAGWTRQRLQSNPEAAPETVKSPLDGVFETRRAVPPSKKQARSFWQAILRHFRGFHIPRAGRAAGFPPGKFPPASIASLPAVPLTLKAFWQPLGTVPAAFA